MLHNNYSDSEYPLRKLILTLKNQYYIDLYSAFGCYNPCNVIQFSTGKLFDHFYGHTTPHHDRQNCFHYIKKIINGVLLYV